jgi:MoxR-like ATPase
LFGHLKGAFTGAQTDRAGLFEAADCGTLFLDELASTSAPFQVSLLRVLQSGEVRRAGSTQTRRVNVRVIGASNAPLFELVEAGGFRADLFYRLSVLTIDLPPLRARAGDVELLAQHFLRRLGGDAQPSLRLTRETADALRAYAFPGNVHELKNALTRAAALSANRLIAVEHLPARIAPQAGANAQAALDIVADRPTMEELERRYFQLVLAEAGGSQRQAAQVLGLSQRTVQRFIARYHLATPTPTPLPAGRDGTLLNPRFEQGGAYWQTGGAVGFANGVARLTPTSNLSPASITQWVPLTPGATYEVTVNVTASAAACGVFSVRFADGSSGAAQMFGNNPRPTTLRLRFSVPARNGQTGFSVQVSGSVANGSWATADDFYLQRLN